MSIKENEFYHGNIYTIHFPYDRKPICVGLDGVTEITEARLQGQGADVAWFEIWRAKQIKELVNAAHVASVEYE